jgi:hypothetical protein
MLVQDYGQVSAQIVGFLALVPVALGGLTILMPTALIAATRRAGWQWFDSFPVWCMAGWLGLVLFAPRPAHGDPTEYQHRSVVLVYAAAFVWTWLWLDRAWQVRAVIRPHSRFLHAVPVLALMAFGTLLVSSWNHDPSRPIFSRGVLHYGIRVDRGLIDAAAYVRIHAVDGDCFALVPSDPDALMDDAATRLSVLSDTPAFLARPGIQVLNGRDRRAAVEERLAALKEVETTADSGAAFRALRKWHVRFLVALGTRGPLFDPDGSHAAFRTDVARVYRIEPEVASGQASQ